MSTHVYPTPALAGDYLCAGAGLCIVGAPLLMTEPLPAVTALLTASAVLFALHGARTARRHMARIELSEDGIRSRGLTMTEIRWRDLRQLKLAHYSTRRDRSGGWLQLLLVGDGGRLRIESDLDDFLAVAARAKDAARENCIRLDSATLSNLDALGLTGSPPHPAIRSVRG